VIVRISTIAILKTKIEEYLDYAQRTLLPAYEAAAGLNSVHLLQRSLVAYEELITISVWDSEEGLIHFVERCAPQSVGPDLAGIEFEPHSYTLLLSRNGQQSDHTA
jgi:heme-degrading monooxygenase HmoA